VTGRPQAGTGSDRTSPRKGWAAALVVAQLLLGGTAAAQYAGTLEVEAVVVPVSVRTKAGRLLSKVPERRFHLYVDGMEFPVQDLAPESDLPLSLGFILDTSGSMGGRKMEACRQLIQTFLDQRKKVDEVALWTFGDNRVLERFPFGTGWYLLPRILESIRPWSTTALYDMVLRVPEVVAGARHPRRAVILLTDGVDNASEMTHSEATELVRRLRTPIYVIGVEPPPEPPPEGGPSFEEVLELLAEGSGGRYQRVPQLVDMPLVVRDLLEELSSRFIISFETSGVGLRRWRSLDVKVDGYQATTRKGYHGTLP